MRNGDHRSLGNLRMAVQAAFYFAQFDAVSAPFDHPVAALSLIHISILALIEAWRLPRRPRVWLDTGTAEGNNPAKVVADARLIRDVFVAKGWSEGVDLHYEEAQGHAHNEQAWGDRFGRVLEYLFPIR